MKKYIKFFLLFLSLFIILDANALTFKEAFEQSTRKPMFVLLYANWATDYEKHLDVYRSVQKEFEDKVNFVELNIASPDTYDFNTRYHIYPNLPYVLMFREGGKISRYITRECSLDTSCIKSKIKSFIQ